jgi:dihydroceramidase
MTFDPVGFWGIPTATVDWCEQNYAVSPYLGEFFNTVSSLAMVIAGSLGLVQGRWAADSRIRVAYGLLALVGLGSVAFHATLRFEFQLLDELPMLYLVTWMAYLLVETGPSRRLGSWFPALLVTYVVIATLSDTLTRGRVQFALFHLTFGSLELCCLMRVAWLALRPENGGVRRIFWLGLGCYGLGLAAWFVDLKACPLVSVRLPSLGIANPQLHAWWHLLVSVGFFLLLRVVAADRSRRLGDVPALLPRAELAN